MSIINGEFVVLDIAGTSARVACDKPDAEANVSALGFVLEGDRMARPISDIANSQKIVGALINSAALFASGRNWSPAELVDFYRAQNKIIKICYADKRTHIAN